MKNSPDTRLKALSDWLIQDLNLDVSNILPASSDASFRRYFRVWVGNKSFIVMDAPPAHEDVVPFIKVSHLLRSAGVLAPEIHAEDTVNGFLLLCDFGDRLYLNNLNQKSADWLYGDAMESLVRVKRGIDISNCGLPKFDEARLRGEINLFGDWFLDRFLQRKVTQTEQAILEKTWRFLINSALEQPQVFVHRDYHSRNLMVTDESNPGILDFQDAVIGPITYDLVSLLRDCYISWPKERVETWVRQFHQRLRDERLIAETDGERFLRWFDLIGLQRHIKVLGIFSRLNLRDGKANYLGDIPRTINYVAKTAEQHPEMTEFLTFLQDGIIQQTYSTLGEP